MEYGSASADSVEIPQPSSQVYVHPHVYKSCAVLCMKMNMFCEIQADNFLCLVFFLFLVDLRICLDLGFCYFRKGKEMKEAKILFASGKWEESLFVGNEDRLV